MLIFVLKIYLIISIICNIISNCIIYPILEFKLDKEGYINLKDISMRNYFLELLFRGLIFFIPFVNVTTTYYYLFHTKDFYDELKEHYSKAKTDIEKIKDEKVNSNECIETIKKDNVETISLKSLNIDETKFDNMSEKEQLEYLKKIFQENPDLLIDSNIKNEGKKLSNKKK